MGEQMKDILNISMDDFIQKESDFMNFLQETLLSKGIELNADALLIVVNEYEDAKITFLKSYVAEILAREGIDPDFAGPIQVSVVDNKISDDPVDDIDTMIIS